MTSAAYTIFSAKRCLKALKAGERGTNEQPHPNVSRNWAEKRVENESKAQIKLALDNKNTTRSAEGCEVRGESTTTQKLCKLCRMQIG